MPTPTQIEGKNVRDHVTKTHRDTRAHLMGVLEALKQLPGAAAKATRTHVTDEAERIRDDIKDHLAKLDRRLDDFATGSPWTPLWVSLALVAAFIAGAYIF